MLPAENPTFNIKRSLSIKEARRFRKNFMQIPITSTWAAYRGFVIQFIRSVKDSHLPWPITMW